MNVLAEIVKPGLHTAIQDGGRPGFRHLGVPLSGAADGYSLALANAAAGNPSTSAALECTLQGPSLRLLAETTIALAGADMQPRLNGEVLPLYQPVQAKDGDELVLGAASAGARCYIAFTAGLAGRGFLGSASTYPPALLGGLDGLPLKAGDRISSARADRFPSRDIPAALQPRIGHDFILRATTAPESSQLLAESLKQLFTAQWTIGRRADRMGLQLEGRALSLRPAPPMASSPVFPGTVQCPPDGAPFLLSADAQTVGGYPRIAQTIAADLHLLGQMRPGDRVWLRRTGAEEARDIALKKTALLADFLPGGFFR